MMERVRKISILDFLFDHKIFWIYISIINTFAMVIWLYLKLYLSYFYYLFESLTLILYDYIWDQHGQQNNIDDQ